MSPLERPRPEDLAHCRALLRAGSKSFATAAWLLPAAVRDRATVLYAFCRVADDRIDDDPSATVHTVDALRERLSRAHAGQPDDDPVDRALSAVLHETQMPLAIPDALLEGLAWDAEGRTYETLDDLHAYAVRVAGTVGAMMTLAMGRRDAHVLARACDLGVAMQLTNVARDVGEDAARGRLYLPRAWMRRAGVDPDTWLARPTHGPELADVVSRLLHHAEAIYQRADTGIAHLPPGCRVAIRAARLIYADIGRCIARAGHDSVSRRVFVSAWRKAWLVARALRARFEAARPAFDPPLGPARFLVAACDVAASR
jgi:phytoene synthase